MGGAERKYVAEAFDTNWIAPIGPHIGRFESELSKLSDESSVAALSSGTAALHLALILLGVQQDDEVLCSTFTFSASVNPIRYVGANPIFIDSDAQSWNMSPEFLEIAIKNCIAKGKKPKAIILVHLYGMPARMGELMDVINKYDIPLIEDAAEALGASYKGKQLGTFGDFGVYSFNGNKIITTSGGGALISKDKKLIDRAKFLATQARDNQPHYEHSNIGYNYRMSNVCAAIGLGQLEVLKKRVLGKREIYNTYKKAFAQIKEITFLDEYEGAYSNYWLTTILINKDSCITREKLRLHLESYNIESRPLWKPMHMQPIFKEFLYFGNGVSEALFDRGLCLPSGTNMTPEDVEKVILRIKELYEA